MKDFVLTNRYYVMAISCISLDLFFLYKSILKIWNLGVARKQLRQARPRKPVHLNSWIISFLQADFVFTVIVRSRKRTIYCFFCSFFAPLRYVEAHKTPRPSYIQVVKEFLTFLNFINRSCAFKSWNLTRSALKLLSFEAGVHSSTF